MQVKILVYMNTNPGSKACMFKFKYKVQSTVQMHCNGKAEMKWRFEILVFLYLCSLLGAALAAQCGWQAGGRLCPGRLCCGVRGICGSTVIYCAGGCQSQCWPRHDGDLSSLISESLFNESDLSSLISESLFNEMLKHSGDDRCHESFYTYNAFITAAKSFSAFGTTGDTDTRKREIAAFLAQTSHETNGGWLTATDEPYTWGYCWAKQLGNPENYCVPSAQYPCAPGKKYYGRGPIQLKNNYNYGQAGQALGVDLLRNPDLVATDPVISFKTAIWFWMTPQSPKPSCHDVITGRWMPSGADLSASRRPGYGVITNIIIGGLECGKGPNPQAQDRIGFYKRYCDMLGVSYGDSLDCDDQRPFGNLLLPEEI